MSIFFPQGTKIELNTVCGYSGAYFGFYRVAFLADDGLFYLDEGEKESLAMALAFYRDRISRMPSYPYLTKNKAEYVPGSETRVFKQVLGLPSEVFDFLDLKEDILSQLHFRKGLSSLKRDSYTELFSRVGKRWIVDEFKSYLIEQGIFFLYDETKSFLSGKDVFFPVFLKAKEGQISFMGLAEDFCAERVVIDLMHGECDPSFLKYILRFNAFGLQEQLDYFVNGIENPKIAALADDVGKNRIYADKIRRYVVGMVNAAYDEFFRTRLNINTTKLSFFTKRKVEETSLYAISSFNGEMYSDDGKDFSFAEQDRNRIALLAKDVRRGEHRLPLVLFYSRLGLPYEGYRKIKDDPTLTTANMVAKLSFRKDIPNRVLFLSIKRYDDSYCYSPGNFQHTSTCLTRRLRDQGIFYFSHMDEDGEERITIKTFPAHRSPELKKLIDDPTFSLYDGLYLSYCQSREISGNQKLAAFLRKLDRVSKKTAASYFFSVFSDSTLTEAIHEVTSYFHIAIPSSSKDRIEDFFVYLLGQFLVIAQDDFRAECLKQRETQILTQIDGMPKETETYEFDLPLPYVTYGIAAYSFRDKYFGTPVLCSCQKDAIEARIRHFERRYNLLHPTGAKPSHKAIVERNVYVLEKLGLPENVYHRIDCREDIAPQIPYADKVCHLCNGTLPLYHDVIFDNPLGKRNALFTYVRAIGSKKGVHLQSIHNENFLAQHLFEQVSKGTYQGIIDIDEDKVEEYFRKYIPTDAEAFVAIIASFFTEVFNPSEGINLFYPLLSNDIASIKDMLFSYRPGNEKMILDNPWLFSHCAFFYNRLAVSYAYKEAQKEIPGLETDTYVDAIYVPGLKKPYVYPGRVFNAYAEKEGGELTFCSCDKKAMRNLIDFFIRQFDTRKPSFLCPIILSLAGLPFAEVYRLRHFPLNPSNVDLLMENMHFEDNIDYRCANVSAPAMSPYFPLMYVLPHKEDNLAEFSAIRNPMVKDGFLLPYYVRPDDLHYDPNHEYNKDSIMDRKLPFFFYITIAMPPILASYYSPSMGLFDSYLKEFATISGNDKATSKAVQILREAYEKDNSILCRFQDAIGVTKILREMLLSFFPKLSDVDSSLQEGVMNRILGFMTFLTEKMVRAYIRREETIGR